MKKRNRERSKEDRERKKRSSEGTVSLVVLILSLAVFCFAGFRLLSIWHNYHSSNEEYSKISESFTRENEPESSPDSSGSGTESSSKGENQTEDAEPPLTVDWENLKQINPDIIGWIYVEAEPQISYPVLQAADNDYYLHRTFRKEQRYAGSIFADYHNQSDFSDPDTVIYGHNMRNGSMFGLLKNLYDQAVYEKDPYFWILTPEGNYRYHIFAVFKTEVNSAVYTLYSKNGPEFLKWEQDLQRGSGVSNNVRLTQEDKTVILSTCTTDKNQRTVVIGKCVSLKKPVKK